jgi:hypothetical protein
MDDVMEKIKEEEIVDYSIDLYVGIISIFHKRR